MRRTFYFCVFLFVQLGAAFLLFSQTAKNMQRIVYIDTETLYQKADPTRIIDYSAEYPISDIWGWSYNNKEYALVCLINSLSQSGGGGVALINVTDSQNIEHIKTIRIDVEDPDIENHPNDVKVWNNYAFVAQDADGAPTYYVDLITALNNPNNTNAGVANNDPISTDHIHNLQIDENGLLFLSNFRKSEPIEVFDVSGSPSNFSTSIGSVPVISGARSHDMFVKGYRIYDAEPWGDGSKDAADDDPGGVVITDFGYQGGPFTVGTQRRHVYNGRRGQQDNDFYFTKGNPATYDPDIKIINTHSAWLSDDGNYLFSTLEMPADPNPLEDKFQLAAYLLVWDVSNIDAPPASNSFRYPLKAKYQVLTNEAEGEFDYSRTHFPELPSSPTPSSIHNVHIKGDKAYLSYYAKGVRVLDVTNPENMSELGYYDVPGPNEPNPLWPAYTGTFGVYPYFASDNIAASSTEGFYLFRKLGEFKGSIDVDTKWTPDVTINVLDDLTLEANTSLAVAAGTVVNIAQNANVTINGTLDIQGTSSNPVTFTRDGASGYWDGIKVYGTANIDHAVIEYADKGVQFYANSDGSVTNSQLKNNSYSGINIAYTTDPQITDCQIYDNGSYGIHLFQSNATSEWVQIRDNTIYNNDYCGIHSEDSSPYVINNEIYGHDYGIISYDIPSAYLGTYDEYGDNHVHDNDYGLGASTSNPFLGEETCVIHGGNNQFTSNTTYHITAINNSYVQAELNWWGSSPPQSSKFSATGGSSIDYSPWLTSPPGGGALLASGTPETDIFNAGFSTSENMAVESSGYMDWYDEKWPLERKLVFARDIMWLGDIEGSQSICRDVIDSYPDSSLAFFALDILWQASVRDPKGSSHDFDAFKRYLIDLSTRKGKKDIYGYAELVSAALEPDKSLTASSDNVRSQYESAFLQRTALYKKFSHYFNAEQDDKKARETADQLQREFPNSFEAKTAMAHFGSTSSLSKKASGSSNTLALQSTGLPDKYALSSNFPNPFNPSTTVEFSLPKESSVDIWVYNSVGQVVHTYSYGALPAGFHNYTWLAKSQSNLALPSGIYFLRLQATALADKEVFNKSIKMLLVR